MYKAILFVIVGASLVAGMEKKVHKLPAGRSFIYNEKSKNICH